MQAIFFGAEERRLFAVFHPARRELGGETLAVRPAVLLCAPMGQEAVRTHRLLRVLADRLAAEGCATLRFDPFGSGDSQGDDESLDLPGWVADCSMAASELERLTNAQHQVWVGFRLGATVACRAAIHWRRRVSVSQMAQMAQMAQSSASAAQLERLVFCEPVLDGGAYLAGLAQATVDALESSFSIRQAQWRDWLLNDPARLHREGLGFALGEALYRQLKALSPAHVQLPPDACVRVVVPAQSVHLASDARRWLDGAAPGGLASLDELDYRFDWTAEEALNTAIVPAGLLSWLVREALGERSGERSEDV